MNPEACVSDDWDYPLPWTENELKRWQKAFWYADWDRRHSDDKRAHCKAVVRDYGNMAYRAARATQEREEGDEEPMGGWFHFMWGDDKEDLDDHVWGRAYVYRGHIEEDGGPPVNHTIIVMNTDLKNNAKLLWLKLQHEVAHYGGVGWQDDQEAVNLENCGKREEKEEEEEDDIGDDGGSNGNGGGGGGRGEGDDPGEGGGRWDCEWYRACAGVGPVQDPGDDPEIEDDPECVWKCRWVWVES